MLKASARIFPIGYIISVDNPDFDPHDFYIDGVWERIKGRVVVGVDENQTEFNETGKTGGSKELQSHNHGILVHGQGGASAYGIQVQSSGANGNFNALYSNNAGNGNSGNLQPYQTAYVWKLISYKN